MADVFGGLVLVDDAGSTVTDATMQSRARCLLLLECCARFLDGVNEAHDSYVLIDHSKALAFNVVEISQGDADVLRGDIMALAKLLGITMTVSEIPYQAPAKGVH